MRDAWCPMDDRRRDQDERRPAAGQGTPGADAAAPGEDTQAVVRVVLDHALSPLGATAAAVWAAAADGSLTLAGQAGFDTAEARRWRYVAPGHGALAQQAIAENRMLWMREPSDVPPPSIGGGTGGTRAVLPARASGRRVGALEVRWPGAADAGVELTAALRRQLAGLADLCVLTLGGQETAGGAGGAEPVPGEGAERAAPAASTEPVPAEPVPAEPVPAEPVPAGGAQPAGPAAWLTGLLDGLLDCALLLRPRYDRAGQATGFLIEYANERFADLAGRPRQALVGLALPEAYPALAADGGLLGDIQQVYATGLPRHRQTTRLPAPAGQPEAAAAGHAGMSRLGDAVLLSWRPAEGGDRLAALLQHAQRLSRIGGFEEDLTTGEITWSEQLYALHGLPPGADPVPLHRLGAHAHPDDAVAISRFLRTLLGHREEAAVTFRLQRADGVVRHVRVVAEPLCDALGALVAVRGAYQDVSSQHWTEVALAVTRDRLAGAEQHAAARHRLARQLQQAIMPSSDRPVQTPEVRVAVRYRPAEKDNRVGGDWYDAVLLPSGQVLLTIGDVAGHGINAANGMVTLRNALRGLAVTGAGPGQLLAWLNTVTHELTQDVTATAVCGLFDPATGTLRWARAGHLPPVLVRDGSAEALPVPRGLLLGALVDASYEERELALRPCDVLLMYTDGLVERRDSSLHDEIDSLLAAAARPVDDLDGFLDRLLRESSADTDDDTCLIAIQPTAAAR